MAQTLLPVWIPAVFGRAFDTTNASRRSLAIALRAQLIFGVPERWESMDLIKTLDHLCLCYDDSEKRGMAVESRHPSVLATTH